MIVKEKGLLESLRDNRIEDHKSFKFNKDPVSEYDKRETYLLGQHLMIEEERRIGREEGIQKGIEKGIQKVKSEIVRTMIKENYTLEQIMKISKLSEKEIDRIKQHIEDVGKAF